MGNEVYSAAVAIGLGIVLGTLLFVPFVTLSYRRRGRLTLGRTVLWAAALVYFLAIWTYTLLPLPDPDTLVCAGMNLDPLAFVGDLRGATRLTDPAVLQLALNVVLFVPLGFFVRVLGGRGILVAAGTGLAVSLFIETTQLTGVWGVYPCAYRVFDVDDLLTNTVGALLGSALAALIVPRRFWGSTKTADAARPRPVTRTRRLLAMLCDLLGAALTGAAASVAVQVWLNYVVDDRAAVLDGTAAAIAGTAVPVVVWLGIIVATGRSVGDFAVELRYAGGPLPEPAARLLRFAGGVGGWTLLGALPAPWSAAAWVFGVAAVALVFTTASARGLPGVLSGQQLEDARAGR